MNLKIDGIDELENLADIIQSKAKRNKVSSHYMKAIVSKCDSVTKDNTPKITGTLINGWKIKKRGRGELIEVEYYNTTEYAPYVEYGHRTRNHDKFKPGEFMLAKGLVAVMQSRERIARAIIEKELKI